MRDLFFGHIRGLISHYGPLMRNAFFVIGVENNLGNQAWYNEVFIREAPDLEARCCILRESSGNGGSKGGGKSGRSTAPGLWTDENSKDLMVLSMTFALQNCSLILHHNWFSSMCKNKTERETLWREFYEQLGNFARVSERKKMNNGTYKDIVTYTGKVAGRNDDFTMGALLNLLAWNVFTSMVGMEKYKHWHELLV